MNNFAISEDYRSFRASVQQKRVQITLKHLSVYGPTFLYFVLIFYAFNYSLQLTTEVKKYGQSMMQDRKLFVVLSYVYLQLAVAPMYFTNKYFPCQPLAIA